MKFEHSFSFGYPPIGSCTDCKQNSRCSPESFSLITGPSYRDTRSEKRLMLIGQDPTIRKKGGKPREKVTHVLMLNKEGRSLYRWLNDLFGEKFENIDIYATNVVKCTFDGDLPTERDTEKALQFLAKFFNQCRTHLIKEITNYKPDYIISFGEPAHQLLLKSLIKSDSQTPFKMTHAFKHGFYDAYIENNGMVTKFKYSPCLHIQAFRVADTYGEMVKNFKRTLMENL